LIEGCILHCSLSNSIILNVLLLFDPMGAGRSRQEIPYNFLLLVRKRALFARYTLLEGVWIDCPLRSNRYRAFLFG